MRFLVLTCSKRLEILAAAADGCAIAVRLRRTTSTSLVRAHTGLRAFAWAKPVLTGLINSSRRAFYRSWRVSLSRDVQAKRLRDPSQASRFLPAASTSRALCYPRVAVYAAVRASSEAYNTIYFELLHSTAINDRCDTSPLKCGTVRIACSRLRTVRIEQSSRTRRCRRDTHYS